MTLAAYTGGVLPRAYVEPSAAGLEMPEMPLFLDEDDYVNVPLENTYQDAYATLPKRWRDVLERRTERRLKPTRLAQARCSVKKGHHFL